MYLLNDFFNVIYYDVMNLKILFLNIIFFFVFFISHYDFYYFYENYIYYVLKDMEMDMKMDIEKIIIEINLVYFENLIIEELLFVFLNYFYIIFDYF